ncbi:MAG TPA: hypothetical protein VGS41_11005 [Chthonomonadales bacterium]|nr:hypothetical protein [Chthonomonadales bacterium]
MKWYVLVSVAVLALLPTAVMAQQWLPIGNIPRIDDKSATTWGMSGMEIIRITQSDGNFTPIMRTETFDARTVEILSRTQSPPLRSRDVHVLSMNGRRYIAVRRYLLMEVKPQDARAAGTSLAALAHRWAVRIGQVLPQVAPMPSRFGV